MDLRHLCQHNLTPLFLSFSLSLSFPLFQVSTAVVLSSFDQATHPNMRTYYFCTDTAKDMESWMKVMTDAALVHTEPVKRWVRKGRHFTSVCICFTILPRDL